MTGEYVKTDGRRKRILIKMDKKVCCVSGFDIQHTFFNIKVSLRKYWLTQ